jgi:ribosomal protein S27E
MTVTRRTLIDNLDGISIRAHRRLLETGCETIGELLDLGSNLHALVGRRAIIELAAELPTKWRARVLEPPPKPTRKQVTGAPRAQRLRVHCIGCGRVSSVVARRVAAPCSYCGGKVERRTKGRPRKQPDAV